MENDWRVKYYTGNNTIWTDSDLANKNNVLNYVCGFIKRYNDDSYRVEIEPIYTDICLNNQDTCTNNFTITPVQLFLIVGLVGVIISLSINTIFKLLNKKDD